MGSPNIKYASLVKDGAIKLNISSYLYCNSGYVTFFINKINSCMII